MRQSERRALLPVRNRFDGESLAAREGDSCDRRCDGRETRVQPGAGVAAVGGTVTNAYKFVCRAVIAATCCGVT